VREELERRGLSVKVATPGREPAGPAMMKGPPVQGDLTLPEVCADCYSAVVFVGGAGVKELFRDKGPGRAVGKIIQEMDAQGKPVTGLCAGILVLADHGALRGRKATRPYGKLPGDVESVLDNSGARLTWSHVERSDNIVTGMGGVDQKSREFANALADVLLNRK
jgi:putative intracellular protease/amidase